MSQATQSTSKWAKWHDALGSIIIEPHQQRDFLKTADEKNELLHIFHGMPMIFVGSTPMFLALRTQGNDELPRHPPSAGYPSLLPKSMLVGSNPHSCWFPHLWEWNSQEFPTFGSEIPQNHPSSQKSTQVLLWTHQKKQHSCALPNLSPHFFATFATTTPRLQPGGESSWLPAETAEAPVDQLLPSLCKSWANLGRFQQFRSLR